MWGWGEVEVMAGKSKAGERERESKRSLILLVKKIDGESRGLLLER